MQEDLAADEYSSPAFVKRARVSYGSLFEGAFNIFDEDLEPSRGRKRTKFGRDSSAWRYTSQSRSPEPEEPPAEEEPPVQAEEPSDEAAIELPLQERRESPRPAMTDEACQTSEAAPSPPSPPTRGEELHKPREPSPAIPAVSHAEEREPLPPSSPTTRREELPKPSSVMSAVPHPEEREPSPMYNQHADVDHDPGTSMSGMALETVPDGVDHVHITQAEHLHTDHGTLSTFQEQALHGPGEPGISSPFGGFAGESTLPWGSSVPYPTLPPSHGFPMNSFMPHHHGPVYPDFSQTFPPPLQHQHIPGSLPPAIEDHGAAERSAEPQPQQSEPYLVSSDVESIHGDTADDGPPAEAEGEKEPMRLEENIKTLIPQQQTKEEGEEAVEDIEERPGPEMTDRVDEDMDVEEAESFPSDAGDEGGDYDTRNYADLQDDDNASYIDEDHEDYGENDEETYDEDEIYDQEGEYEEEVEPDYDQEEYEDWEGAGGEPAAPPASSAPVFIDLISDSEDEDGGQGEAAGREEEKADVDTSGEDEWPGEEEEGENAQEDGYSDEESEDEGRSREGSEEGSEEDDDNRSAAQNLERTPSPGRYDEADDMPSHRPAPAEQDEDEGAEDVDLVSKPEFVTVLSSPPPEEPTSPETTQAVEQPVSTESTEVGPAADTERHKPEAETEPSQPVGVTMADEAQADELQAAEPSEPAQVRDQEEREPSTQGEAVEAQEPSSLPDADAREPATEGIAAETSEPASLADREAGEPSAHEPAADVDVDVEMVSPVGEPSVQKPSVQKSPKSTHDEGPEPVNEAQEDEDESMEAEASHISLDDEVQADIERQMESSFMAEPAAGADEQSVDGGHPREEAKAEKGELRAAGAEALASPPLTQATQSQMDLDGATHEEGTAAGHAEADHLLTPNDTQLASASQSFEEAVTTVEHDDPAQGTKVTLGSPTMEPEIPGSRATPGKARRNVTPLATDSFTSQAPEDTKDATAPGSAEGLAITVKSLRSRGNRSASAEKKDPSKGDSSKGDPSTRLAKDSVTARESSARRDPSTQLAKASAAARRSATADGTPQAGGRTTRSKTRSVQMSASPEPRLRSPELGDAAEPELESQTTLKLQLNKNLRLSLLDLTALKVLRSNVNRKVDVLGVATAQPPNPQRPKHGPRDFQLQLTIADQTTAPNSVVFAQVFRPHIESLPLVKEGDVVLLRHFTITAIRGQGFGLRSCETSSWAVWEKDREDALPQIKGPPVEISSEEGSQAGLLRKWYAGLDERAMEKLGRANARLGQG